MKTTNRRNIAILAFILVVMMLGLGVVIPILPFYVEKLGAGGIELGLLVAAYAAMRLIFGPIWGSLSDRYGRKPILMIGVFGYGIAMVLFGLSTELWMLFLFRILSGVLSSATSPTTMAYIGDSTSERERGMGMGILGAAVGLGTILGPGLGGILARESLSLPFFIAGGMSLVGLILIALFLPESLPKAARHAKKQGRKGLRWDVTRIALRGPLGLLFAQTFMLSAGLMIFYSIFGLYALEKFGLGPEAVGGVFMVFGLGSAVAQGGLVGPLTRRWGESQVLLIATLASAAGFLFITMASTYPALLLACGFFTLAVALLIPLISALTSRSSQMEQGITMGLSNAFMSLGRIVGPLWAGYSFDLYLEIPYYSGAGIMVISAGVSSLAWLFFSKPRTPSVPDGNSDPSESAEGEMQTPVRG